jgi:thiol-disulfide isomerase/thioredoxin
MPMKLGDSMPSFEGATMWLNENGQSVEEFVKGSPTLVYFWATSCGICKENMPKLNELKSMYGPKGLKAVAIHMPRYETDTDLDGVKNTIAEHSINDICAVDNMHKLKDSFLNEQGWVPVYYLFDAEGKLKTRSAGEFGIGILTSALEKMFPVEGAASA